MVRFIFYGKSNVFFPAIIILYGRLNAFFNFREKLNCFFFFRVIILYGRLNAFFNFRENLDCFWLVCGTLYFVAFYFFHILHFIKGTSTRRRNDAISRLNSIYLDIIPAKKTIEKCLKYLCDKGSYRMLKDWPYEMNSDPLQSESESENDDTDLDNATENVVVNLSQEIINNKKKQSMQRRKKNMVN